MKVSLHVEFAPDEHPVLSIDVLTVNDYRYAWSLMRDNGHKLKATVRGGEYRLVAIVDTEEFPLLDKWNEEDHSIEYTIMCLLDQYLKEFADE